MLPFLAVRTGLEPATPGVTGRYSNQLNYRTNLFSLMHFSQTRMQMYVFFLNLQIFSFFFSVFVDTITFRPLDVTDSAVVEISRIKKRIMKYNAYLCTLHA